MLWLAGLMGMMVLGSVAVVSTPDLMARDAEDDEQADAAPDSSVAEGATLPDPGLSPEAVANVAADFPASGLIAETGPEGGMLFGTGATDLLGGGAGDDELWGDAGDDELVGDAGTDTVHGGADNDTLHGEAGGDLIYGNVGDDDLYGHDGADTLDGGDGQDTLYGGLGDDALSGGSGDDGLMGREGADTLRGGAGTDTMFGGWDDDTVIGILRNAETGLDADESDYLNGGDGDDTLVIGQGDIATGGNGADSFVLGDWFAPEAEAARLMDFDAAEDQLLVVFDDSDTDEGPELELRSDPDDPEVTQILVGGTVMAVLPTLDMPSPDQIVLIGASAMAGLTAG